MVPREMDGNMQSVLVRATRVASLHVFRWRCGHEYDTHQAIKRRSSFKFAVGADFIL